MPRNIRNTRRNFARPSDSITPAASAGALGDVQGYPGSTISVTKNSNPLGPVGNGVYTVTSIPSGLTGSLTTTATTASVSFSAPASTSAATYEIYVSDSNYNGTGKPVKVTNSLTVPAAFQASLLVIAGGGAGGWAQGGSGNAGGGGGGGGTREFSGYNLVTGTNYAISIGAGGSVASTTSNNGQDTNFSGVQCTGGGAGGRTIAGATAGAGQPGGSGGGSGGRNGTNAGPGSATAITPYPTLELTTVQGFAGGTSPNPGMGSAGGGASAIGGAAGSGGGGNSNNNGRFTSITGTGTRYAGGGGGGGTGGGGNSNGGSGAGGGDNQNGENASGTGGGGGGACSNPNDKIGGAGGSGLVIIRYPNTRTITIGAGLTGSTATDGSFRVTTITAGSGNVSFA